MTIYDRNMKAGTQLVGRYHKQTFTADVVEVDGGNLNYDLPDGRKLVLEGENKVLRYRLADGREFKSPSAAGMAITGHACDGWVFWSVQTAETAAAPTEPATGNAPDAATVEPETTPVVATTAAEPAPAKKRIFRLPNQKGVPTGQTRWYCHECGKSFLVQGTEIPAKCPQGHKA